MTCSSFCALVAHTVRRSRAKWTRKRETVITSLIFVRVEKRGEMPVSLCVSLCPPVIDSLAHQLHFSVYGVTDYCGCSLTNSHLTPHSRNSCVRVPDGYIVTSRLGIRMRRKSIPVQVEREVEVRDPHKRPVTTSSCSMQRHYFQQNDDETQKQRFKITTSSQTTFYDFKIHFFMIEFSYLTLLFILVIQLPPF